MDTFDTPLAVYCSVGNQYRSFESRASSVSADIDAQLDSYGACQCIRDRVRDQLVASVGRFDEGFRFERRNDYRDPNGVVVFVRLFSDRLDSASQENQIPKAGQGWSTQ